MEAALYLIPVTLGDTPLERVLPSYNRTVVLGIRHFIVEEVRTARRFLKQVERSIDIDALTFYPMGKHADAALFARYLEPLRRGEPVGVISEAGKLYGEILDGDIVIDNNDKVVGYVNIDGTITAKDGKNIGRTLSRDLAVDNNDNILGKIYKIGATILGNDGKYIGRLSPEGRVLDTKGQNIGYIKNNGSFIDLDKKVSGYVLQEVAKNRRN